MFGKFSSGMDKRREEDEPFVDEADFIAYLEVFLALLLVCIGLVSGKLLMTMKGDEYMKYCCLLTLTYLQGLSNLSRFSLSITSRGTKPVPTSPPPDCTHPAKIRVAIVQVSEGSLSRTHAAHKHARFVAS